MEGTRSYGASITTALTAGNIPVVEAKPPRKQARAGVGKTDEIDATAAAMSVLGKDLTDLLLPRAEGVRSAISVLLASRQRVDHQRTMNRNALNALVREIDLGLDTRKALTDRRLIEISAWRHRVGDTAEQRIAREEVVRLAVAVRQGDQLSPGPMPPCPTSLLLPAQPATTPTDDSTYPLSLLLPTK